MSREKKPDRVRLQIYRSTYRSCFLLPVTCMCTETIYPIGCKYIYIYIQMCARIALVGFLLTQFGQSRGPLGLLRFSFSCSSKWGLWGFWWGGEGEGGLSWTLIYDSAQLGATWRSSRLNSFSNCPTVWNVYSFSTVVGHMLLWYVFITASPWADPTSLSPLRNTGLITRQATCKVRSPIGILNCGTVDLSICESCRVRHTYVIFAKIVGHGRVQGIVCYFNWVHKRFELTPRHSWRALCRWQLRAVHSPQTHRGKSQSKKQDNSIE